MKNGIQMAERHNKMVRKALAEWLKDQDFTQKELARAIGCDPSTISGWKNDRNMKAADLLAIVEAVGVPPSVLLGLAESPYRGGFRDAVRAAARRVRDLADELEEAEDVSDLTGLSHASALRETADTVDSSGSEEGSDSGGQGATGDAA